MQKRPRRAFPNSPGLVTTAARVDAVNEDCGGSENGGSSRLPARGDERSGRALAGDVGHGIRITFENDAANIRDTAEGSALVWLCTQLVVRVAGVGDVVVGWLSDPRNHLDRVTFEVGANDPIDVASTTATFVGPECHDLFRVPRAVPVTFGFVAFIGDPSGDGHLSATVRLRTGATHRCAVQTLGDRTQLDDLLARAPLTYGLAVMAHLLSGHCVHRARPGAVPPSLEHWATRMFERIDPQHDYGRGASIRSSVACYVDAATQIGALGILIKGWLLTDRF